AHRGAHRGSGGGGERRTGPARHHPAQQSLRLSRSAGSFAVLTRRGEFAISERRARGGPAGRIAMAQGPKFRGPGGRSRVETVLAGPWRLSYNAMQFWNEVRTRKG